MAEHIVCYDICHTPGLSWFGLSGLTENPPPSFPFCCSLQRGPPSSQKTFPERTEGMQVVLLLRSEGYLFIYLFKRYLADTHCVSLCARLT